MASSQLTKTVALTTGYTALATVATLFRGDLIAPDTNSTTAYMQGSEDDSDIPMAIGSMHVYNCVDLSTITVKGSTADVVRLVGERMDGA